MNSEPSHAFIEAVKRGERKQAPLIEALSGTLIDRTNIENIVNAFNELDGAFGAELISRVWANLDSECRRHVMHQWVDKKDKDQQAAAFHILAAKLLNVDSSTSLDLLDRVHKFASGSPTCRRRVVQATRVEWIATTPQKSRLGEIEMSKLDTPGRSLLLDWIADACAAEIKPSDSDKRKDELKRESMARTSIVKSWVSAIQSGPLPDAAKRAVERNSSKLGLKVYSAVDAGNAATITDQVGRDTDNASEPNEEEPRTRDSQTDRPIQSLNRSEVQTEFTKANNANATTASSSRPVIEEEDDALREAFRTIQQVIKKSNAQHEREKKQMATEIESLRATVERSASDLSQSRVANRNIIEQITAAEDRVKALESSQASAAEALSVATAQLQEANADLERERKDKLSIRKESHDAVDRETQREKERLLIQIGQRLENIIEGYQEIKSRGPLPPGTPAMVGEMMDELISTLVAAGVKFRSK